MFNQILKEYNLYPRSSWAPSAKQGEMAATWFKDDLVIQKRSLSGLKRFKYGQDVLAPLFDQDLFRGARSDLIYIDDDYFWTVAKKITGQTIYSWKNEQEIKTAFAFACKGSEDILQVKKVLNSLDTASDQGINMIKHAQMQKDPLKKVIDLNKKIFQDSSFLNDLTDPVSPIAFSHGDFSIHNVIYSDRYYFIDWEQAALLPRHADLALFTSFFLRRSDPKLWTKRVDTLFDLGFADVLEFNQTQWYQTAISGMLRSGAYFPGTQEEINNWQKGLITLINRI
jgi:thiamine kinase-like enzyme